MSCYCLVMSCYCFVMSRYCFVMSCCCLVLLFSDVMLLFRDVMQALVTTQSNLEVTGNQYFRDVQEPVVVHSPQDLSSWLITPVPRSSQAVTAYHKNIAVATLPSLNKARSESAGVQLGHIWASLELRVQNML